jgi:hypothetical protein
MGLSSFRFSAANRTAIFASLELLASAPKLFQSPALTAIASVLCPRYETPSNGFSFSIPATASWACCVPSSLSVASSVFAHCCAGRCV